jgi:hypothetical protein
MDYYFDESTFDPQNIEHWLLLLSCVGLAVYGLWLAYRIPEPDGKASHRYNRETGQIERNED